MWNVRHYSVISDYKQQLHKIEIVKYHIITALARHLLIFFVREGIKYFRLL